jgi:DNA-binding NtrC family response regulator
MEPTPATPLVALIDADEQAVMPSLAVLQAAGYGVGWFRQPWRLLDDIMENCPMVVVLAGRQARHFDRWHAVQALHEMGCAVILATNDAAARRELFATPRGRCAVGALGVPYDPTAVVLAVGRAVQHYPANLCAGAAGDPQAKVGTALVGQRTSYSFRS